MYKFNFILDDKDYLEFNKFHHNSATKRELKKPVKPRHIVIWFIVFIASMVLETLRPGIIPFNIVLIVFFCCIGLSIFLFLFYKQINAFFVKRRIKSMKEEGKLPFGKTNRVHFDEEGIYGISELAEIKVVYDNLEKVIEDNRSIYIYFSAMLAFILPHRAFESEQQKTEFLTFINGKVPNK